MSTMNRRMEIINILIIRRHITTNELAQELGVSTRTIQYDIQALSPDYPIYTKPGENGGLFIREDYKPYNNSLTKTELKNLLEIYEQMEGIHKEVLFQVIHKYGPDKLEIYPCHSAKAHNLYRTVHSRRRVLMCFLG